MYRCKMEPNRKMGGTPGVGTAEGILDFNAALTGDDLKEFADNQLFPYLTGKNPVHPFVDGKQTH